jgi:hypothetical protein
VTHPTLLKRLKCESESVNNKKESWGTFFNSLGVEGRVRVLGWGL